MTGRPGFGLTGVHIHVVDITVLQQLRGRAKQNRQRQVHYAICAVRSPRHLILDIQSAGSVSLGCIVEKLTLDGLLSKSCGPCESQTRVLSWQPVHSFFNCMCLHHWALILLMSAVLPWARLIGIAWSITSNAGG